MHSAIFFEPALDAHRPFSKRGLAVARRVFPGMTMQADVNEIGRYFLPHRPVWRIGHTDRDLISLKAFGYFVIKPRFMAKLDRVSRAVPVPQIRHKLFQPLDIFFQGGRELPQQRVVRRAATPIHDNESLVPPRLAAFCCA